MHACMKADNFVFPTQVSLRGFCGRGCIEKRGANCHFGLYWHNGWLNGWRNHVQSQHWQIHRLCDHENNHSPMHKYPPLKMVNQHGFLDNNHQENNNFSLGEFILRTVLGSCAIGSLLAQVGKSDTPITHSFRVVWRPKNKRQHQPRYNTCGYAYEIDLQHYSCWSISLQLRNDNCLTHLHCWPKQLLLCRSYLDLAKSWIQWTGITWSVAHHLQAVFHDFQSSNFFWAFTTRSCNAATCTKEAVTIYDIYRIMTIIWS